MKVLIIGGTRFIGKQVAQQLVATGHDVAVFHRGQTEADLPSSVRHILGDRQQLSDFRDEFKRFAPQVVLDMIAYVEQDAVAVMQTFRGIAERVVAISSQDVYRTYGILWRREITSQTSHPSAKMRPCVAFCIRIAR
ncbi:MAG: NAD-dependent epimerase/dehydratase family protein [Pyrinomonadaceae bacterium]